MADDAPTQDLSEETQPSEDQPEKLRVHSLARVLGTTSKRVLDALTALDGKSRGPQSTVGEDEAERVREALADSPGEEDRGDESSAAEGDGDEPESRLILETAPEPERADYLPLFVAPQPVQFVYDADDDDDDDDDG